MTQTATAGKKTRGSAKTDQEAGREVAEATGSRKARAVQEVKTRKTRMRVAWKPMR